MDTKSLGSDALWGRGWSAACLLLTASQLSVFAGLDDPVTSVRTASFAADGRLQLSFNVVTNAYYVLYRGEQLGRIDRPEGLGIFAEPEGILYASFSPAQTQSFFRLAKISTDFPLDTDQDGIDDVFELRHALFLDPLNGFDAEQDFDLDGASNLQEYRVGTNPTLGKPKLWTIAAGWYHALAIKADGSLWHFGLPHGGMNIELDRFDAKRVDDSDDWKAVAVGLVEKFALKADGTLWAWGGGWLRGRDDPPGKWMSPTQLSGTRDLAGIVPGPNSLFAIRTNGALCQWRSTEPGKPDEIGTDTDWSDLACGFNHCLALKRDGSLWAWGFNRSGQLGLGTSGPYAPSAATPTQVGEEKDWASVAASQELSLAIKADGSLWGWGYNGGRLPGIDDPVVSAPRRLGKATDWVRIVASPSHCLALKRDHTLWAWGSNSSGELGLGSAMSVAPVAPSQVGESGDWATIGVGLVCSMALKRDGTLWTWGYNVEGILGNSEHTLVASPRIVGAARDWKSIAAGERNSAGIKLDGSLWCWGENFYGQLGDGSFVSADSPRRVGTGADWVQVWLNRSGFGRAIALHSDSTLWAWGNNDWGALGTGGTWHTNSPTPVTGTNRWILAACRGAGTHALSIDGSLWSWPTNWVVQTGVSSRPEPGNLGYDWLGLGVGDFGVYGIKTDTTLWDLLAKTNFPWSGWVTCGSGIRLAAGIRSDGTLWRWGATDYYDTLSYSASSSLAMPTRLTQETDWAVLSVGGYHSLALKRDGSLWAWGANFSGQLGDPSVSKSPVPIRIGTSREWKSIAAGTYHSLAVKVDGTLWAWGENLFGQLGLPATWRPFPVGTNQYWMPSERFY